VVSAWSFVCWSTTICRSHCHTRQPIPLMVYAVISANLN